MSTEKEGDKIMDEEKAVRDLLVTLTEVGYVVILTAFGPSLIGETIFSLEAVKADYDGETDETVYKTMEHPIVVQGGSVAEALSNLVHDIVEPRADEREDAAPETDWRSGSCSTCRHWEPLEGGQYIWAGRCTKLQSCSNYEP